jgi:hypothetical protein
VATRAPYHRPAGWITLKGATDRLDEYAATGPELEYLRQLRARVHVESDTAMRLARAANAGTPVRMNSGRKAA